MHINEQYQNLPLLMESSYTYIGRDGTIREETEENLIEHVMDVYINEILTMKLICIPQHLSELVLGRLLTESIITSIDDVESIFICEYGKRARVTLKKSRAADCDQPHVEVTPTCCTGNHILNEYFITKKEPEKVQPIPYETDWIFDLADRFHEGTPLHQKTWSTHSSFLARKGEILFACEDIGRHNALDKTIGYALRHSIPLEECIIYSSGRIPTDMVIKAIAARVPVFASKAAPTHQAIELAKSYNLTLLWAARRDRMKSISQKSDETPV